jgi:NADH-quinone oxidoreductase subunit J
VGAIAILIVMAILLTRSGESPDQSVLTSGWLAGVVVTVLVFTMLGWAVLSSSALPKPSGVTPQPTVKDIGTVLMTRYVLPLEIVALMLTAAMIGAVVIAYKETRAKAPLAIGNRQSAIGNSSESLPVGSCKTKIGGAA